MDPKTLQLLMGSAGAGAAVDKNYIEDVFSTWLYTGNGSTQTITNGIDLSGKGGLVWIKSRSAAYFHSLTDTERGANQLLQSQNTDESINQTPNGVSFSSSGFTLNSSDNGTNENAATYASWTFRKAPKFFDVVTYTGNGVNPRTLPHSLGSVPGFILLKSTSTSGQWIALARKTDTAYSMLSLNSTAAENVSFDPAANNITSTTFSASFSGGNTNGVSYVAYLFAHNAGGFGDSGNDSVVSCGGYTHGAGVTEVNVGFEPQWILLKRTDDTQSWFLFDTLRGITADATRDAQYLSPNSSAAETGIGLGVYANGFRQDASVWGSGGNYIYIAIRRGPMKTPTDATKVFNATVSSGALGTAISAGFPLDTQFIRYTGIADSVYVADRLRGVSTVNSALSLPYSFTDAAIADSSGPITRDWNSNGFDISSIFSGTSTVYLNFRRAPGFFDVVAYTGDGTSNRAIPHNLSVTPQLIIVKSRNNSGSWRVWSAAFTDTSANLDLNSNGAPPFANGFFPATGRNSSNFIVNSIINTASTTYIAYLFASCPGISKTGSYTGTGTTLNVDCGFTNGARLVIIKRTDSTGDWYGWDTARGIVSGNDPYFLFNSVVTPVTNTDYIDPLSSGFQISSTAPVAINASGGTYIYLAIA
jgi:hypothetical protein